MPPLPREAPEVLDEMLYSCAAMYVGSRVGMPAETVSAQRNCARPRANARGRRGCAARCRHHVVRSTSIKLCRLGCSMSRPKSARVFLKLDGVTVEFMWANLGPDESVMLGFPWPGKQMVELVLDDVGELRPPRIVAKEEIGETKISFHPS